MWHVWYTTLNQGMRSRANVLTLRQYTCSGIARHRCCMLGKMPFLPCKRFPSWVLNTKNAFAVEHALLVLQYCNGGVCETTLQDATRVFSFHVTSQQTNINTTSRSACLRCTHIPWETDAYCQLHTQGYTPTSSFRHACFEFFSNGVHGTYTIIHCRASNTQSTRNLGRNNPGICSPWVLTGDIRYFGITNNVAAAGECAEQKQHESLHHRSKMSLL